MSVRDVSAALKHVHNNLDVDAQWQRARSGLALMTELEKAQVWAALSSHTLSMDEKTAPVVFSQYKTLYKAALKSEVKETEPTQCLMGGLGVGVGSFQDDSVMKMLEEYKECLKGYQSVLTPIVDMKREGKDQIVLIVQELISNSTLLTDMKKQIKDTIDKATKDLAKEAEMAQIKAALLSIQADKANESSMVKIIETLTAMQTKLDMLSSKLGNSTLGALAMEVNNSALRIAAMETSHDKLRESVDGLFASLRTHTTEVKQLQSDLGNSNKSIDGMTKLIAELNTSVGRLTDERELLTNEIQKLGKAYSVSTDEIKARLVNVEKSSNTAEDVAKRLQQIETSYATMEDIQDLVARLSTDETQPPNATPAQPNTEDSAAARARGSMSPPPHPYARNARPGKGGMSNIAKERGIPNSGREGSSSISPQRRQPADGRPPFKP